MANTNLKKPYLLLHNLSFYFGVYNSTINMQAKAKPLQMKSLGRA